MKNSRHEEERTNRKCTHPKQQIKDKHGVFHAQIDVRVILIILESRIYATLWHFDNFNAVLTAKKEKKGDTEITLGVVYFTIENYVITFCIVVVVENLMLFQPCEFLVCRDSAVSLYLDTR